MARINKAIRTTAAGSRLRSSFVLSSASYVWGPDIATTSKDSALVAMTPVAVDRGECRQQFARPIEVKELLFKLIDAPKNARVTLTESFAM